MATKLPKPTDLVNVGALTDQDTVPEGQASGVLGFQKVHIVDEAPEDKWFKLAYAKLGETIDVDSFTNKIPVNLKNDNDKNVVVKRIIDLIKTNRSELPVVSGGKKRHSKTAHKRKHGRTRRAHKGKK